MSLWTRIPELNKNFKNEYSQKIEWRKIINRREAIKQWNIKEYLIFNFSINIELKLISIIIKKVT